MKLEIIAAIAVAVLAAFTTGCQTTAGGALTGAALGAAGGAVIGNNVDGINSGEGAIGGAVIGGVLGGAQGNQNRRINETAAQADLANTRVVTIYNSNGSTSEVILKRVPEGWQGPRGEIYTRLPSQRQLEQAYGF